MTIKPALFRTSRADGEWTVDLKNVSKATLRELATYGFRMMLADSIAATRDPLEVKRILDERVASIQDGSFRCPQYRR